MILRAIWVVAIREKLNESKRRVQFPHLSKALHECTFCQIARETMLLLIINTKGNFQDKNTHAIQLTLNCNSPQVQTFFKNLYCDYRFFAVITGFYTSPNLFKIDCTESLPCILLSV